jgi:hypothetical protein
MQRNESQTPTFLCLASYEKGQRFLEEAKAQGCRVLLLTSLSLKEKAQWPKDSLDDIFYMPDEDYEWNLQHMVLAVSHLCRTTVIDRIIPLDDFDLEKAALLREHLRIPGLGETATRYFRDKLAMRMRAAESGIRVPEFTSTFNYQKITHFVDHVSPPWVLKPRLMAGAIGIKKFDDRQAFWDQIHATGDQQSYFVLERFVPGNIFHVDSIWYKGEMLYAITSAYGTPPLEVTSEGGVFTTRIVERGSGADRELRSMNEKLLKAFGLYVGVSHTEFIQGHDGLYYFLETAARVGGAHISDLIESATGINMWTEWARLEAAAIRAEDYRLPKEQRDYAGLLVSLARQEWPDTSQFQDPELVWRMEGRRHHVGFIVKSPDSGRVETLLQSYTKRVRDEYQASAPPRDKPGE